MRAGLAAAGKGSGQAWAAGAVAGQVRQGRRRRCARAGAASSAARRGDSRDQVHSQVLCQQLARLLQP